MKFRAISFSRSFVAFFTILGAAASCTAHAADPGRKAMVIGFPALPSVSASATREEYQKGMRQLVQYLSKKTGRPLAAKFYPYSREASKALQDGDIPMAYLKRNTFPKQDQFALIATAYASHPQVLVDGGLRSRYDAVLVKNCDNTKLNDDSAIPKGTKLALTTGTQSGDALAKQYLTEKGLSNKVKTSMYPTYQDSFAAVKSGDADLAATWDGMYLENKKPYNLCLVTIIAEGAGNPGFVVNKKLVDKKSVAGIETALKTPPKSFSKLTDIDHFNEEK